jgi:DNA polymerase-1
MLVGQAPGADEVVKGKPFTGPSGYVLKRTLAGFGLKSGDIRISASNAVQCKTPTGKEDFEAIAHCRTRLFREIIAEKPKVIAALGNNAVISLLNMAKPSITAINAMAIDATFEVGGQSWKCIVVPTVHPAAVLRKPGDFKAMQAGLLYAVELATGRSLRKDPGTTEYFVVTKDNIGQTLKGLISSKPKGSWITADIETDGFSPRSNTVKCMALNWEKNKVILVPESLIWHKLVKQLMESSYFRWDWHHGKFDVKFFRWRLVRARVDGDTLLRHYALDETSSHDLEHLSVVEIGARDYKKEVDSWKKVGWRNCPLATMYKYCAEDTDFGGQLRDIFEKRLDAKGNEGLRELYETQLLQMNDFFIDMELTGMYANPDQINKVWSLLDGKVREAYDRYQQVIRDNWHNTQHGKRGEPVPEINPDSPKQVSWLFYEVFKFKVPRRYKQDTAKDTLKAMDPHPVIYAHLDFKAARHARSTYAEGWARALDRRTRRIHPTYNVHRTGTGRSSCKQPNAQNVPRKNIFRNMVQATPAWMVQQLFPHLFAVLTGSVDHWMSLPDSIRKARRILLECDLKSAEIRVLANVSRDPELCAILNEGRNLHHEVAVDFYGNNYTKDDYIRAKAVNFGVMYGRTAHSLVMEYGHDNIPPDKRLKMDQAESLIEMWDIKFPVAMATIRSYREHPAAGKVLVAPNNRRRRFGVVTEHMLQSMQNEAANHPIQGPASDITAMAAAENRRAIYLQGGLIINFVHDSLLFDLPMNEAVIINTMSCIRNSFFKWGQYWLGDAVPMEAEFKAGMKWGAMLEVEAELDDDGVHRVHWHGKKNFKRRMFA